MPGSDTSVVYLMLMSEIKKKKSINCSRNVSSKEKAIVTFKKSMNLGNEKNMCREKIFLHNCLEKNTQQQNKV